MKPAIAKIIPAPKRRLQALAKRKPNRYAVHGMNIVLGLCGLLCDLIGDSGAALVKLADTLRRPVVAWNRGRG